MLFVSKKKTLISFTLILFLFYILFLKVALFYNGNFVVQNLYSENKVSFIINDAFSLIPKIESLKLNKNIICAKLFSKGQLIYSFEKSDNCENFLFHHKFMIASNEFDSSTFIEGYVVNTWESNLGISVFCLSAFLLFFFYVKYTEKIYSIEKSYQNKLIENAKQVAHDIRSPLSALNMLTSTLKDLPEENRLLIRNSVQRINDIANDLLQKGKGNPIVLSTPGANYLKDKINSVGETDNNISPVFLKMQNMQNYSFLVPIVVDNIVSEKRIQYREKMNTHINVDLKNSFGLFVNANPNDLSRVISNLINNSVEALPNQTGNVEVSLFVRNDNKVIIQIKDNGSGIPKCILEKLGQSGVTHGKGNTQSGSGLGVYHAMKTIQEMGGAIHFDSITKIELDLKSQIQATGTTITIELPKADTPDWFAESIQLKPGQEFVTVDDDISIHQIWKARLQSLKLNEKSIKLISFTSVKEFREYFKNNLKSAQVFLIDYEFLNQNDNGLKIITELGIQDKAILVTSRFDEANIRSECEYQKIKILPKQLAGQIKLTIVDYKISENEVKDPMHSKQNIDDSNSVTDDIFDQIKLSIYHLCLIDDDKLIHSIWGMVAKEKGLRIKMFERPEDFISEAGCIDKSTPIYIDVSLGNNVNGIEVAEKVHELGFENINLATGFDSESIIIPKFIRNVITKDFPEAK